MALDILAKGLGGVAIFGVVLIGINWLLSRKGKAIDIESVIGKAKAEEKLEEIHAKESDVVVSIKSKEKQSEEQKQTIKIIAEKANKKVDEVLKTTDIVELSNILSKEW